MYAIAKYDAIYNFSINDFFSDFRNSPESSVSVSDELSLDHIDQFYDSIATLELSNAQLEKTSRRADISRRRLCRRLTLIGVFLTISVAALFGTGYIATATYLGHRVVFDAVTGDWKQIVFGAIISTLVSAGMVAASRLIRTGSRSN